MWGYTRFQHPKRCTGEGRVWTIIEHYQRINSIIIWGHICKCRIQCGCQRIFIWHFQNGLLFLSFRGHQFPRFLACLTEERRKTLCANTIIDSSSVSCVDLQNLRIRPTTKLPIVSGNRPGHCYCARMKGVRSLCFMQNIIVLSTTLEKIFPVHRLSKLRRKDAIPPSHVNFGGTA